MHMNFISVIRIQSFLPSMIILGGQEEIMSETKREVEKKSLPYVFMHGGNVHVSKMLQRITVTSA